MGDTFRTKAQRVIHHRREREVAEETALVSTPTPTQAFFGDVEDIEAEYRRQGFTKQLCRADT